MEELQANHASMVARIKALEEALAAETKRREVAEQRVAELSKRQSELEAGWWRTIRCRQSSAKSLKTKQLAAGQEKSRGEQTALRAKVKNCKPRLLQRRRTKPYMRLWRQDRSGSRPSNRRRRLADGVASWKPNWRKTSKRKRGCKKFGSLGTTTADAAGQLSR
jgi:hypothetical protein